MKPLVCEMCNSNDVIKQDGLFVCQYCGTKYSIEEARKIMFEGSIKIDNSDKLRDLFQVARRALENKDYNNARIYYEKILEEAPASWEATFYSSFHLGSSYAYIEFNHLKEYYRMTLLMIRDNTSDISQQHRAVMQIASSIYAYTSNYVSTMRERYNCTNVKLQEELNDRRRDFERDYECIKRGIEDATTDTEQVFSDVVDVVNDVRSKFEEIINILNTCKKDYLAKEYHSHASGCYVATCVYGSYDCPQVWTLRRFRDNTLASTWYGRLFIYVYYAISPTIVRWMGSADWFKRFWGKRLDKLVTSLQANDVESTPYQDKEW